MTSKGGREARSEELYSVYGRFYDATQGKRDADPYLRLLRRHHPKARRLLEIACGTGAHLACLADHYTVEGLDVSRTMLLHARRKLPGVKFHRQDMAEFRLDGRFDAIVCPYDSINHLLKFSDWLRTFEAVKQHLNERGVFVFDMNTEERLNELSAAPPWVLPFDSNYMIMDINAGAKGITDWDIKIFERMRNGHYRLHQDVIQERSFSRSRIDKALENIFDETHTYDGARWSRPKKSSDRLFYVCR